MCSGATCLVEERICVPSHVLLFFFLSVTWWKVRADKHVLGLVQQIGFCTWTRPGENWEREGGGGWADSGRECGGVIEPKGGYLRALECQRGRCPSSQWTDPGPSALWHDFSL